MPPYRSVRMSRGSCPSSTSQSATRSTKPVDPHTYTRGCSATGTTAAASASRVMRPGGVAYDSAEHAFAEMEGTATVVGTPDDLVRAIHQLQTITGGFGTVIGFAHDWASREATFRSWELVARHVIPEVNGLLDGYRESQRFVIGNREVFERGTAAIMAKINENERAARALAEMGQTQPRAAIPQPMTSCRCMARACTRFRSVRCTPESSSPATSASPPMARRW